MEQPQHQVQPMPAPGANTRHMAHGLDPALQVAQGISLRHHVQPMPRTPCAMCIAGSSSHAVGIIYPVPVFRAACTVSPRDDMYCLWHAELDQPGTLYAAQGTGKGCVLYVAPCQTWSQCAGLISRVLHGACATCQPSVLIAVCAASLALHTRSNMSRPRDSCMQPPGPGTVHGTGGLGIKLLTVPWADPQYCLHHTCHWIQHSHCI